MFVCRVESRRRPSRLALSNSRKAHRRARTPVRRAPCLPHRARTPDAVASPSRRPRTTPVSRRTSRLAEANLNPKQLDRFRDRFSPAGAKADRRDARVLASALRTDPHCLRQLESTDPTIVELREWSRLSEDLTRARTRLANRMREPLWRYYPQLLAAVGDDLAAPWPLDLWQCLPTPRAAQRVREKTLARLLAKHRIRRIDTAALRRQLPAEAVKVAPGAAEAAVAHVQLVVERLVLVHQQRVHAHCQLERLMGRLAESAPADDSNASEETEPRGPTGRADATILLSLPAIGTGVSPRSSPRRVTCRRDETTPRCAASAAWRRSPAVPARASSSRAAVSPPMTGCVKLPSTGLGLLPNGIRRATASTALCAPAATDTRVPSARSPTA